jgi:hypothetical protein
MGLHSGSLPYFVSRRDVPYAHRHAVIVVTEGMVSRQNSSRAYLQGCKQGFLPPTQSRSYCLQTSGRKLEFIYSC